MTQIHPSAYVSTKAEIGSNVSIGPFSIVEDNVFIGNNCRVAGHVAIKSGTALGADNEVAEGAVLGGAPQHTKAGKDLGTLLIGNGNRIREYVTIHRGLAPTNCTKVGDGNMIMVNAHIAHDCHIGNNTVIVNNVMLAGHITVGDGAYFGGAAGVHQFCRIGRLAMIGGQSHLSQDVPPFVMVDGISSHIVGLNLVGLRRAGFTRDEIKDLKAAYRVIYRSGLLWNDTLEVLKNTFKDGPASEFHTFFSIGDRGFVQERKTPRGASIKIADSPDTERPIRRVA
ncbi:MAG: acyl-ACP--UDP-N-acetylglucosamine O-acyltransferase [Planctomycetaceae bacterium]|nr:acyl-ACP--UDP-N-acetylglucosamine O-acyltransferase [Planctomycetales bacterium]MCB9875341.1 acyl-ACP--UDP-N-acetylglucosamine O-acyltransferase [Planctomycetaceae bacterium]MCB9936691.1 acyl-ACP--UDP-N-acetylglucosamine O-acyltransferase [Planctomycetaceae bacterium]